MTKVRRPWRALRRAGVAVLASGVLAAACSSNTAAATTVVGGPVTIKATNPAGALTPWSSGQVVDITVAANDTLSLTNLEKSGYTGIPAMKAEECDDPGGLKVNLPTEPTSHCDGQTILSTAYVNRDGSFLLKSFTLYALPDSTTFGESADGVPKCGTQADQCVLYIGPNQLDFSKPHLFSAPFLVQTDSNDRPSAAPATASQTAATSSGSGGGTLAFTGPLPLTPMLVVGGFALVAVGTVGRRRVRAKGVP